MLPLILPAIGWQAVALHAFLLKVARGQQATARDLFAVGDILMPAIGSICVAALAVLAGSLLCIVPGVILFLMFFARSEHRDRSTRRGDRFVTPVDGRPPRETRSRSSS